MARVQDVNVNVNVAVCAALGLDAHDITGIDLSFRATDVPRVTVHLRPSVVDGEVVEAIRKYHLVPDDDEAVS